MLAQTNSPTQRRITTTDTRTMPPDVRTTSRETALPCPTCPLVSRLDQAKAYFRAQQAEIAQLQERLARYQWIGLRRYQQAVHPAAQHLYGSLVWAENVLLRRENARQRQTIQALHHYAEEIRANKDRVIHDLQVLLRTYEAQGEGDAA